MLTFPSRRSLDVANSSTKIGYDNICKVFKNNGEHNMEMQIKLMYSDW